MKRKQYRNVILTLGAFHVILCCSLIGHSVDQNDPPLYGYRIVNSYPHDPQAFTQGLIYRDGYLFESTGRKGLSSVRKVELETGKVVQIRRIENQFWGEGLTDWNGRLVQLTWLSNIGFVYDLNSFNLQDTFRYSGQGWGLTHDGKHLIMSDGSDTLRFLDPADFSERRRISVRDGSEPVRNINELEYVRGEIFANIWHTNRIARISPKTGRVLGWIDLTGILSPVYKLDDPEAVLNGIAFDLKNNRLFVTGKLWPNLFEIRLVRR